MDFNSSLFSHGLKPGPYVMNPHSVGEELNDNPRKLSRKNPWGSRSYADLITQAIETSPEKRLTLSQIYDWMIRNIPFFSDQAESNSSAGWKNSIRHNLSLHKKFLRIRNDSTGKSSWWTVNAAAGSGRTPRRKGPYRRRRGKAIPHHQLENLPSALKNKRRSIFPNSVAQRNTWGSIPDLHPWNNPQYVTDSSKRRWESFPRSEEIHASSNHSKPFNSGENLPPFSALYNDQSCKPNFNSSSMTPFQSGQLFITQTASLKTETNSYGSFNRSYRTYLQEQFIFRQTTTKPVRNKTEYFMSPHHLSGSYITTEIGRNKIDLDYEISANRNEVQNALLSSTSEVLQQILPPGDCDFSTDVINFPPNNATQSSACDLNSILDEIIFTKTCDENYKKIYDSLANQSTLIELHADKDLGALSENKLVTFDELNRDSVKDELNSIFQRERTYSTDTENNNTALPNSDLCNFNLSPNLSRENKSFSFREVKNQEESVSLNIQKLSSCQSESTFIEEIIQKLNSPHPDRMDSGCGIDEVPDDRGNCPSPGDSTFSMDANGDIEVLASLNGQMNIPYNLNDLSTNLELLTQQPSQTKFTEKVLNNTEIDNQSIITDAFGKITDKSKCIKNSKTLTHPTADKKKSNSIDSQNIYINGTDTDKTQWQPPYSEDGSDAKSLRNRENISESIYEMLFSNSENHSESIESANLSQKQNSSFSKCVGNTIHQDYEALDSNSKVNTSSLSFPSKTNVTTSQFPEDILTPKENMSPFPSAYEIPLINNGEKAMKENMIEMRAPQGIIDTTQGFDQFSLNIQNCEKENKLTAGTKISACSESPKALNLFDEYDDPRMLIENVDPCLLNDSSNSCLSFDADLPSLQYDESTSIEKIDLDSIYGLDESPCLIEDSIFELIRDDISLEDNKFLEFLNFVTSDSETDSKDGSLLKNISC